MELAPAVKLAVDAALGAGAGDAEGYAWSERPRGAGASAARSRASATRPSGVSGAGLDRRTGRIRLRNRALRGGPEGLGGGAAEAAKLADEDENAAPPRPQGEAAVLEGLHDHHWWRHRHRVVESRSRSSAPPWRRQPVGAVETAVYADSTERMAILSSAGVEGGYEASSCFSFVQALAAGRESKETGLGFGLARAPAGLDPDAIGAEGAPGRGDDRRRQASLTGLPGVFDPTVAASFIGLIGSASAPTRFSAAARRSRAARRHGRRRGLVMRDDGMAAEGLAARPVRRRGHPARPTALIEGGKPADLPL